MRVTVALFTMFAASNAFARPGISVDADAGGRQLADLTLAELVSRGLEVYDASWVPAGEHPEFTLVVDGGVVGTHVQLRTATGTIVARFDYVLPVNAAALRTQAFQAAAAVALALAGAPVDPVATR